MYNVVRATPLESDLAAHDLPSYGGASASALLAASISTFVVVPHDTYDVWQHCGFHALVLKIVLCLWMLLEVVLYLVLVLD